MWGEGCGGGNGGSGRGRGLESGGKGWEMVGVSGGRWGDELWKGGGEVD